MDLDREITSCSVSKAVITKSIQEKLAHLGSLLTSISLRSSELVTLKNLFSRISNHILPFLQEASIFIKHYQTCSDEVLFGFYVW